MERPNIKQALSSLKDAMTAEHDLILDDDCYDDATKFKNSVSDEAVLESEDLDFLEEVFSSEDWDFKLSEEKEEDSAIESVFTKDTANDDVFVLTRMIQEDGTILNLDCKTDRPAINISDDKIEGIVREEVKPLIKDWLDKNMHSVFSKMRKK